MPSDKSCQVKPDNWTPCHETDNTALRGVDRSTSEVGSTMHEPTPSWIGSFDGWEREALQGGWAGSPGWTTGTDWRPARGFHLILVQISPSPLPFQQQEVRTRIQTQEIHGSFSISCEQSQWCAQIENLPYRHSGGRLEGQLAQKKTAHSTLLVILRSRLSQQGHTEQVVDYCEKYLIKTPAGWRFPTSRLACRARNVLNYSCVGGTSSWSSIFLYTCMNSNTQKRALTFSFKGSGHTTTAHIEAFMDQGVKNIGSSGL